MIKDGQVVELSYVLKGDNGDILDSADKSAPFAYLHGYGQIIPGLEEALNGLKVGDKKTLSIPPEKGYGQFNPDLRIKLDLAHFPTDQEVKPGMQFVAEMDDNHVPFIVHKVEDGQVFVDGNHPLAGQNLNFEVEVLTIRDATKEELEHGHAHGPGGHIH